MKIAVVGAGLMGSGIAQTFAQAGFEVTNIDTFEAAAAKAAANVEALFAKKVAKGKLTQEQKQEILGRLHYSTNMEDVRGAGVIVEAVPEKIELKKSVFAELDRLADEDAILVSNTSGLSISEIAARMFMPRLVL